MQLEWDPAALAAGLQIPIDTVAECMQDGRFLAFVLEHRVAALIPGATLMESNADYDLECDLGRFEVRAMTKRGINFAPSNMMGAGRTIDPLGFAAKLGRIDGYLVVDVVTFPIMQVHLVRSQTVADWWGDDDLRANMSLARTKFLNLIPAHSV
tara:strand:+ start:58 stop:519 length:462 start_codon:yes stop_codon:yes gene_type:complete